MAAALPASSPSLSSSSLSESWAVAAKHTGCYTGGKVSWSESTQVLGCLCGEELQLVDVNTREATRRVAQEGDGILTFALDPMGQNACTSHRSGLLRHWRLQGDKPEAMRAWKAHEQVIADVCFDASGGLVASGSIDRTVRVWDFAGYFCTHNFKGHVSLVSIVKFHPARLQLVSIAESEARLWDLQSSTCVAVMKDHLSSIASISFARVKGATYHLLTAGRDQVANVWSLEGKCPLSRSIPAFENVEGIAAVPTKGLRQAITQTKLGKDPFATWLQSSAELPSYVLLTVGDKALLRAWSPADGRCLRSQASPHAAKGLLRQVHCLDQANGRKVVTIGEDLNLVIWSLPEFEVVNYIMGHNEEIVHVQLIPQLSWPESGGYDKVSSAPLPAGKPTAQVTADRFVAIANDEHPRVVNRHGFGASLLRGHTDVVIACDVSADGRWIVTGGKDQSIRIWSAAECQTCCVLKGHAGAVSALSFPKRRPKGPQVDAASQPLYVVSGSHDKIMKVWELPKVQMLEDAAKTGKELRVEKSKVTVVAHSKEVNDVVVSPNNKLIASGGHDKLVRIWSFPGADLMGECKGHRRGIWSVAFHPSDQVIVSASGDTTVRLWNLKDFSAIRAFQGHSSAVLRVCFLSNGMQLMTSSVDGLLKLWQIRTAECAATMEEHTGKVWCIDVLGETMVSGGSDSKLCVWKDTTEAEAKTRHDEKADAAMKDSRIGLLVQQGKIEIALGMALDLNRVGQMKTILTDYAMGAVGKRIAKDEQDEPEPEEAVADEKVDLQRWVNSLSDDRLEKLVDVLERWNSNRKMASLAQMLMGLVLAAVSPAKLAKLEGMNATCATVLSYSSRHMARIDSLLQKTFLFDLVLQSSNQGLALQEDMDLAAGKKAPAVSSTASAESALTRTMAVLLGPAEEADSDEDSARAALDASKLGQQGQIHRSTGTPNTLIIEEASGDEAQAIEHASAQRRPRKKRRKEGKQ